MTTTPTKKASTNLPAGKAGKAAEKTAPSKSASSPRKSATSKKAAVSVTEAPVYSMTGASKGTIALPPELFAAAWNADLVHQ